MKKQCLIGLVVVTGLTALADAAITTLRAESFAGGSATAGIQRAIDAATAKSVRRLCRTTPRVLSSTVACSADLDAIVFPCHV